ncbi:MAG: phosphatase PAP2 family protein [bacterium]
MSTILNIDQIVYQQMFLLQHAWLTPVMIFITDIVGSVSLPIFVAVLIFYFWRQKQKAKIYLVIFGLGGGLIIEMALKMIIGRVRPPVELVTEITYSFPSGHATMAAIFFAILIYCFKDKIKNLFWRRLYIFANIFLCLLIGFTRLYLGVHWLSDVVAGLAIGMIWFFIVEKLTRNKK